MSKSSKSSSEITSLKATLAERDAQIAALTAAAAAAAAAKPARVKKERAPRDPAVPRMLSPYIVFCTAQRAAHTGEKKLTVKELGVAWKLLSDEQRLSYKPVPAAVKEPKPEKQKRVKKSDAAAEAASEPAEGTPKTKKERKPRDPDAPKKPLSGFMLYQQQERAKTPDTKIKSSDLSVLWNALSDEVKATYKRS
jgi:hypothetical protein